MIVAMAQVDLIGRRADLDRALGVLQELRAAEPVPPETAPPPGPEEVALAADRAVVESLRAQLAAVGARAAGPAIGPGTDPPADLSSARLTDLAARVAAYQAEDDALRREAEELGGQAQVLDRLGSLVPELASLSDAELADLQLATVVLVLDDPDGRVVSALGGQLREVLADRHLLVTTADHPADHPLAGERGTAVGCLLVVPRPALAEVEGLLGSDRITPVSVPEAYRGRSLTSTVAAMRRRLETLPAERAGVAVRLRALLQPEAEALAARHHALAAEVERRRAAAAAVVDERTFRLRVWVPRPRLAAVTEALAAAVPTVVVAPVGRRDTVGEPPVLLAGRRVWRPYGRLVGFLSWPAPGGIDPSGLMGVVLPFLFGVMVGDVVYGGLIAAGGWWLRRRYADRPVLADAGRVLLAGGIWATVFGFLFGEALGSLGNTLGMPPLWFYRGGPAALEPLLLFAVAIGAAHIVLGLLIGLWTAVRLRQRHRIADRAGTLLVLVGLFALAGSLVSVLPAGLVTPAVIAMVLGLVVVSVSHGALGLLLGPLELLGTLGNVLSYLRVAAVGLASVYLANVANELAATAPLLLGILIATFFHTLNLALAAFSPTVQSLRLHYVEFFSKFHDGGGRAFAPLGAGLPTAAPGRPRTAAPDPSAPAAVAPERPAPTPREKEPSWN